MKAADMPAVLTAPRPRREQPRRSALLDVAFSHVALDRAAGGQRINAKVLRGFGSAGVLEVEEDFDRKTYRAVYTVAFEGVVYVLLAFEKKSKQWGRDAEAGR